MKITPMSLVTAALLSSTVSVVIHFFRKKYQLTRVHEQRVLLFLYILSFIRLLIPIDFSFTRGIRLTGVYADLIYWLSIHRFSIPGIHFTIGDLLCILWGAAAAIQLIKLTRHHVQDLSVLKECPVWDSAQIERVHGQLLPVLSSIPGAAVCKCSFACVPFAIGTFRRRIFLPDIDYTDEEMFYILLHEYIHFRRYDTLLKPLFDIFFCIFWWIPFASVSRKDIEQLLELGCDMSVIRLLSETQKPEYMTALLDSLKHSVSGQKHRFIPRYSVPFALQEKKEPMIERFHMLARHTPESPKHFRAVAVFVLCLFCGTYLLLPIPGYEPDKADIEEDGAREITPENSFILKTGGKYYLIDSESGVRSSPLTDEMLDEMVHRYGFKIKEI
ncbi:MAG: M56 family metallopeptidase [Lachnospiraceae bacterium]|nr:M56 family metallopeptidase [Lachnospiraceae bacterium]